MTRFTGNRGEWGELYALCELLAEGCIYNADADLQKNESQHVEVLAIERPESDDRVLKYSIDKDNEMVEVLLNGRPFRTVSQDEFRTNAKLLLKILKERKGRSLAIPELDDFIDRIGVTKLKPSGTEKPDITVEIYDARTSSTFLTHYSIKSFIGSNPTLVNSTGLTYFYYELVDFDESDYEAVSEIPSKQVKKRVGACSELAKEIRYSHLAPTANVFQTNLMRVHPYAESTVAYMLMESYLIKGRNSRAALDLVKETNPMDYENPECYDDAYRNFLWAAFFGMVPSQPWFGQDSVDGYLLINDRGEVLSYLVVKRNTFSEHLLDSTKFDTPSTSEGRSTCDTGCIFYQDGKYYLTLNLQLRYDAKSLIIDEQKTVPLVPDKEEEPKPTQSASRFQIIS